MICAACHDTGWVCERHPAIPWDSGDARLGECPCGAPGMLCLACENVSTEARDPGDEDDYADRVKTMTYWLMDNIAQQLRPFIRSRAAENPVTIYLVRQEPYIMIEVELRRGREIHIDHDPGDEDLSWSLAEVA